MKGNVAIGVDKSPSMPLPPNFTARHSGSRLGGVRIFLILHHLDSPPMLLNFNFRVLPRRIRSFVAFLIALVFHPTSLETSPCSVILDPLTSNPTVHYLLAMY